jgi:hypothetical protein
MQSHVTDRPQSLEGSEVQIYGLVSLGGWSDVMPSYMS